MDGSEPRGIVPGQRRQVMPDKSQMSTNFQATGATRRALQAPARPRGSTAHALMAAREDQPT